MSFAIMLIYNLIYVAFLLLGVLGIAFVRLLYHREKSILYHQIEMFTVLSFTYIISDFLNYYFMTMEVPIQVCFFMTAISDILFYVLVIDWVYVSACMLRDPMAKVFKPFRNISIGFIIISEGLNLIIEFGDLEAVSALSWSFYLANTIYGIFVMAICVKLLYNAANDKRKIRKFEVAAYVLTGALTVYMMWIAYYDYLTIIKHSSIDDKMDLFPFDPFVLFYAVICIAVIKYFQRRDPLRIGYDEINTIVDIDAVCEEYDISSREREVLRLINAGKSNMEIAVELKIAENTVKRHVNSIFKKTGTAGRHELVSKIQASRHKS